MRVLRPSVLGDLLGDFHFLMENYIAREETQTYP